MVRVCNCRMNIDPVSLRLFVAVMEEGTLAHAADREHIAASALSKRVSELESALGTTLFDRSNKGAQPTAAAFTLLSLARGVLHGMEDIAVQMKGYASGQRGQVRLAANISAITQFLPAELRSFRQRAPQVEVHLQERISTSIARAVADGTSDIGILNQGSYGEELTLLPYRSDELVAILPPGHALKRRKRLRFADMLDFDFVGAHPHSALNNQLLRAAGALGRNLRLRIQLGGLDAICLMVAAGLGVAVVPRRSAQLYEESLKLRPVVFDEPWAVRHLMLCVRSQESLSPAGSMLLSHLQEGSTACVPFLATRMQAPAFATSETPTASRASRGPRVPPWRASD